MKIFIVKDKWHSACCHIAGNDMPLNCTSCKLDFISHGHRHVYILGSAPCRCRLKSMRFQQINLFERVLETYILRACSKVRSIDVQLWSILIGLPLCAIGGLFYSWASGKSIVDGIINAYGALYKIPGAPCTSTLLPFFIRNREAL